MEYWNVGFMLFFVKPLFHHSNVPSFLNPHAMLSALCAMLFYTLNLDTAFWATT